MGVVWGFRDQFPKQTSFKLRPKGLVRVRVECPKQRNSMYQGLEPRKSKTDTPKELREVPVGYRGRRKGASRDLGGGKGSGSVRRTFDKFLCQRDHFSIWARLHEMVLEHTQAPAWGQASEREGLPGRLGAPQMANAPAIAALRPEQALPAQAL